MEILIGLIVAALIAIAILKKKPAPPTPTPECRSDSDCSLGMVCKNGVCVVPEAPPEPPPTPIPPSPYVCSVCGETFLTIMQRDIHIMIVHGETPAPIPPPIPIPTPPTPIPIPPTPSPTPKEGDKKCDGAPDYRLWVFSSGKWMVQRYQAPECGYVAPPVPIPPPKPGFEETMIKGFVRQRWTDNPISGALVTITDPLGKVLTTCYTDSDGWFLSAPLKTGIYPMVTDFRFVVSATGYKSTQDGSEIIGTRAGAGQTFIYPADMKLELIGYGVPFGREVEGSVNKDTGENLPYPRIIWTQITIGPAPGRLTIPTGIVYTERGDNWGSYEFPLITPGKYLVTVEATGYATYDDGISEISQTDKANWIPIVYNYKLTKL